MKRPACAELKACTTSPILLQCGRISFASSSPMRLLGVKRLPGLLGLAIDEDTMDNPSETYSEEETVARREATLKVMLATPHKPHKTKAAAKSKPKK